MMKAILLFFSAVLMTLVVEVRSVKKIEGKAVDVAKKAEKMK